MPIVYKTLKKLSNKGFFREEGNDQLQSDKHTPLANNLLTSLKDAYIQISRQNMLMSAELIALDKLAKEMDIQLLPFKGPVLAQIAYGDITLRQFSDLDIFILREDFRKFSQTMLDRNYNPLYPIEKFTGDKVMFGMNNDCPFYNTERGLTIGCKRESIYQRYFQ